MHLIQDCFDAITFDTMPIDTTCIVCLTTPATVQIDKKPMVKTGIHLIFPRLFVKIDTAICLRDAVVQYFCKHMPTKGMDWSKIIDLAVYQSKTLRLVGSSKLEKCTDCKGRDRTCGVCGGMGRIDMYRKYLPKGKMSKDRVFECETPIPWRDCSIRAPDTTIPVHIAKMPDWFRTFFFCGLGEKPNQQTVFQEDTRALAAIGVDRADLLEEKPLLKLIEKEIHTHIPIFKETNLHVTCLYKFNEPNVYYFVRTDCTFCMNKADYHKSNTVYFVINEMGLFQKCLCRCPIDRKFGECKHYKSACYPVDNEVRRHLFPTNTFVQTTERQQCNQFLERLRSRLSGKQTHEKQFQKTK